MKPEQIKLSDWARIFAGEVPPAFYLEILIRAALVYLLLMVSMRLMGKRMSTQISRLEIAAMVSLAAAIGVPMLAPDRGLLPPLIIAAVVVLVTRLLSAWGARNQRVESITQDHLDTLIAEGVLDTKKMKKVRISREQLLSHLRQEQLLHTGTVLRLYMEANGSFTLVRSKNPRPGLTVLPEWDQDFIDTKLEPAGNKICGHCGALAAPGQTDIDDCGNCGATKWTMALQEKQAAQAISIYPKP